MTIYVYHVPAGELFGEQTYALLEHDGYGNLFQTIQAEPTDLPITENFAGPGIEIGEVFNCNDVVENLIRVS